MICCDFRANPLVDYQRVFPSSVLKQLDASELRLERPYADDDFVGEEGGRALILHFLRIPRTGRSPSKVWRFPPDVSHRRQHDCFVAGSSRACRSPFFDLLFGMPALRHRRFYSERDLLLKISWARAIYTWKRLHGVNAVDWANAGRGLLRWVHWGFVEPCMRGSIHFILPILTRARRSAHAGTKYHTMPRCLHTPALSRVSPHHIAFLCSSAIVDIHCPPDNVLPNSLHSSDEGNIQRPPL